MHFTTIITFLFTIFTTFSSVQALAISPNTETLNKNSLDSSEIDATLARRGSGDISCIPVPGWSWSSIPSWDIVRMLAVLNGYPGDHETWHPQNYCAAKANSCAYVGCTLDSRSAIYLCNDQNQDMEVACSTVVTYVRTLSSQCEVNLQTGGQIFDDTGDFNIIVHSLANGEDCPA